MTDVYGYWRAKLAGKDAAPFILPTLHGNPNDDPQPGMYRMRPAKGAAKVPVHIWLTDDNGKAQLVWRDGLTLVGTINHKPATAKELADRWLWCEPVTKADFEHYKANKLWPGDIGHNSGDLSLAEEITDAARTALDWLKATKIADKTSADIAANHRAKLNDLAKRADAEREERKRPHMDAAKAVDLEYKPLVIEAKEAADTLRDALTVWMRDQEAKAKAVADAARKAAEEAAKAHGMEDVPLPLPEPVKVQAGGQRGRKAGLRTVVQYEVTDMQALLAYLATNAELNAAAADIGRKLMKAGIQVPGMIAKQERVAA